MGRANRFVARANGRRRVSETRSAFRIGDGRSIIVVLNANKKLGTNKINLEIDTCITLNYTNRFVIGQRIFSGMELSYLFR